MKRQAKNSDDPLYRNLHKIKMAEEQLVAALHELADRIEGQASHRVQKVRQQTACRADTHCA